MTDIKTETRNVKQTVRRFTDQQRKQIIYQIDNRPSNVTKSEMFNRFGMGNGGNLYYVWKEKFRREKEVKNVKMTKPMFFTTNGKKTHTVTLSVEVGSIMELIDFCSTIIKTPKVKSVLSVE